MVATHVLAPVATLALFEIHLHLLSTLPNRHGFQDKYIDFGQNTTLTSKQVIQTSLEAIHRSRLMNCSLRGNGKITYRNSRILGIFIVL